MKEAVITIREMEEADIVDGMRLSTQEGWNQTERDWQQLVTGSNTGLVLERDERVIATMTAANYSNTVAWIGMVLVERPYRRQGYAALLLDTYFKMSNLSTSFKLDATAAGCKVYQKAGFSVEYSIARMTNWLVENAAFAKTGHDVRRVSLIDIDRVNHLDSIAFGAERLQLIRYLAEQNIHGGWLIERAGEMKGFALGRPGNKYYHIGPVTAETDADATQLIAAALSRCIGQPVVIDVMADKAGLIEWLVTLGFSRERDFIRMCKDKNAAAAVELQYCICGPEFG